MRQCHYHVERYGRSIEVCFMVVLFVAMAAQAWTDGTGSRLTDYNRTTSDADWKAFKERFKKNYSNPDDDSYRRSIRAKNLELIREHNAEAAAGKFRFNLSENGLIDMTVEEYKKLLGYRTWRLSNVTRNITRSRRAPYPPSMPIYSNTVNVNTLPATVNWTGSGRVGPVQNQGHCGSCWSYSAAGSLEGQYFNVTGQFIPLSEQNLIDCSAPQGNLGCNGGSVQAAYWYVQQTGIDSLLSYPDTSDKTGKANPTCNFNASQNVMKVASWLDIAQASEPALQQAVALVGPVSAAIDAKSIQFQLYSSGVYSNQYCSSTPQSLDHAILVVGYGDYNGVPYWLIKNSWGPTWGINGYMMLARNSNNMCGIATDATYPVVGWTAAPSAIVHGTTFSRPIISATVSSIHTRQGVSGSPSTSVTSPLLVIFHLCLFVASLRL